MRRGAIILCGGQSSRMGRDKASLPFGDEAMMQRVVRLVGEVVELERIVVVAAAAQTLPELPAVVKIVHDTHEYSGPLQGLANGMEKLANDADAVYVSGCDVPLLEPAFVERMFELLENYDVAVPFDGEQHHPLAAVYRMLLLQKLLELLDRGERAMRSVLREANSRAVTVDLLQEIDPKLLSLRNVNDEVEYRAALNAAGLLDKQS